MFATTVKTREIIVNLRIIIDVSDLFVSLFRSNIFRYLFIKIKISFYLFICLFVTVPCRKNAWTDFQKNLKVHDRLIEYIYVTYIFRQVIFSIRIFLFSFIETIEKSICMLLYCTILLLIILLYKKNL